MEFLSSEIVDTEASSQSFREEIEEYVLITKHRNKKKISCWKIVPVRFTICFKGTASTTYDHEAKKERINPKVADGPQSVKSDSLQKCVQNYFIAITL